MVKKRVRTISYISSDDDSSIATSNYTARHPNTSKNPNDLRSTDNRVVDEINKDKLSDCRLHTEFLKVKMTAKDMEKVKQMKLNVKYGRFTKNENQILTRNWEQLCDDFFIINPHKVLGYFRYNEDTDRIEKAIAKELIKQSEMYLRLAKDLPNRTIAQIYQRARKLFSGLNKADNLTEEQRKSIIELKKKNVKNTVIASEFLADIKTIDGIARRNVLKTGSTIKKYKWSEEEDKLFIETIKNVMEKNDLRSISDIPWTEVAEQMGNRTNNQCREHFLTVTFFKISNPDSGFTGHNWKFNDSQKLVYFLKKCDFEDESQIDWDFIKEVFSEDLVFSQILKNWNRIKLKIDNNHNISYQQLIDKLYAKFIGKDTDTEQELQLLWNEFDTGFHS